MSSIGDKPDTKTSLPASLDSPRVTLLLLASSELKKLPQRHHTSSLRHTSLVATINQARQPTSIYDKLLRHSGESFRHQQPNQTTPGHTYTRSPPYTRRHQLYPIRHTGSNQPQSTLTPNDISCKSMESRSTHRQTSLPAHPKRSLSEPPHPCTHRGLGHQHYSYPFEVTW